MSTTYTPDTFKTTEVPSIEIDLAFVKRFRSELLPTMHQLVIQDAISQQIAVTGLKEVKDYIKNVKSLFDKPCATLHDAWKAATGERKRYLDEAESIATKLDRALVSYNAALKAAEEKARREEYERQMAEAAAQEAVRQAASTAPAILFGDEEPAVETMTMPDVIPASVAALSLGVGEEVATRKVPMKANIDLRVLILACAERLLRGDESLLPYLEANVAACNAAARAHGEQVSLVVPGLTAYREEKIKL